MFIFRELDFKRRGLFILMVCLLFVSKTYSQSALWVGETYRCDATSAVMGLTSDISWTNNGGYVTLTGAGFYRDVKITQYFSGSATIKCTWKYRLYSSDKWRTQSKTWTIKCKENPVSISPAKLTLAPGATATLTYSHKYSNEYVSAANAYFSSNDRSVASVTNRGEVTALKPGKAYIHVYSKIADASNSPYCLVTVEEIKPTGVSLPSSLCVTEGESKLLTPTVIPDGASTGFSWESNDYSIATVSSSGKVTGVKKGQAIITVTTLEGGFTANCKVEVKEPPVAPTDVVIEKTVRLYKGFEYVLKPKLSPINSVTSYSWVTDDSSVAAVDTKGRIYAKGLGKAVIKVTTKNKLEAICEVNVVELPDDLGLTRLDRNIRIIGNLVNRTLK